MSLKEESPLQLLQLYGEIINELKSRKIARTSNGPIGDYAEWLVSNELNLNLSENSELGYDAKDINGIRYQIKARQFPVRARTVQLSAIRGLDNNPPNFQYLIAVGFNQDFTIRYAAKVPHQTVKDVATYYKHTNSHILHLRDSLFDYNGVERILQNLWKVDDCSKRIDCEFSFEEGSTCDQLNNSPKEAKDTLPIKFLPNQDLIHSELINTGRARIKVFYKNGEVRELIWNAKKITAQSNLIGNIRSRPQFRKGEWQRIGISNIEVSSTNL